MRHVYDRLKELVPDFQRDVRMAHELISPNPEDDLIMKTAIVGFSYNSPTEQWGPNHYNLVRQRIDSEYSSEDLSDYGPGGANIRLFIALCLGFLLGLYQSGSMDDGDFHLAEAQLPGLIELNVADLLRVEV